MGYEVKYRDEIRCTPPLGAAQRRWLRRLAETRQHETGDVNAVPDGVPGYWCPWLPTRGGHLAMPQYPTKEHMPGEWLRWLLDHGPWDGAAPQLRGTVHAKGHAYGDEWRLVVDGDRMVVQRDRIPCAACWLNCRELCAPGAAYRFTHPEPVGNAGLGSLTEEEHDRLLDDNEERCTAYGFRPVEAAVEVVWPPPPGSPPPLPPFQILLSDVLARAGIEGMEAQARLPT